MRTIKSNGSIQKLQIKRFNRPEELVKWVNESEDRVIIQGITPLNRSEDGLTLFYYLEPKNKKDLVIQVPGDIKDSEIAHWWTRLDYQTKDELAPKARDIIASICTPIRYSTREFLRAAYIIHHKLSLNLV